MYTLKLTQIGSSTGVIIPKEALAELNVEKGDKIFLTKSKEGFIVTPYDSDFENQMDMAEKIMKKRRHVLKKLAE